MNNALWGLGKKLQTAYRGFSDVIPAGTTKVVKWQNDAKSKYFDSIRPFLENQASDDKAGLVLLLPDGETVIRQIASDWNFASDKQDQGIIETGYWGQIPPSFWIGIVYTSTGATDVKLRVNLYLHEDID